jgi:hypothetical protein
MDAVEPSVRGRLAQSAAAAERVGDPSAPFLRALADRTEIEEQRDRRVERLLDAAERVAGGQIAKIAAAELPGAVERLVLQRYRVMVLTVAAGMIVATGLAFGAGWWFGRGPDLQCSDQDGGRICYVWEHPPAKPARR